MSYFFTEIDNDKERWNLVEDYFLGKKISELIKKTNKTKGDSH
jgi:hypothetical protein